MDVEHCVIARLYELARFLSAADKTPLQRLSYMSAVACRPLARGARPLARRSREGLQRFGNDDAKIRIFSDTGAY